MFFATLVLETKMEKTNNYHKNLPAHALYKSNLKDFAKFKENQLRWSFFISKIGGITSNLTKKRAPVGGFFR